MAEVATSQTNASAIRTVLFDLDGTLADTAPDLALALNTLLEQTGNAPLPYERIRQEASYGGTALVRLGFGLNPEDDAFAELRQRFLHLYQSHICIDTRLFDGMESVLDEISSANMNWGIVTNKPAYLTDPLVKLLGLTDKAAAVVSGDTTNNSKPHPEPLLHACELAGSRPEQCLYVGDAQRDIEAGQRAGMKTLVATFGYIRDDDNTDEWGADGAIASPKELIEWIRRHG
ncbi:MAG: phosphoglycolate phosphatase [Acidithiobacillales bacterium SG8_45]|jgi:2-phosphoglycolate phosphatase|nr:MAG: phosphoglycolate phosphatase [Acidithiobacillales bacterium SG8_45]